MYKVYMWDTRNILQLSISYCYCIMLYVPQYSHSKAALCIYLITVRRQNFQFILCYLYNLHCVLHNCIGTFFKIH